MSDYGFVEWFRPGEHARVEAALEGMVAAGARRLRTHVSWAEYHAEGGEVWFDWLIPTIAARLELLPCVHYTPPSLSRTGRTSGAPRELRAYADFIDHVLTRHGAHFSHVELWNEPNNLLDWDWRADPDYALFCEMIGAAAYWARKRGWKPVLGGPSPFDPLWLNLMGERGVLAEVAAVGFHGFPGTWDSEEASWHGWDMHLGEMRAVLGRWNPEAEVWITETGYSTWRNDQMEQVRRFARVLGAGADRVYWYAWRDLPGDVAAQEGLWFDPRHYHLGAVDAENQPKLLARLLRAGGADKVREMTRLAAPATRRARRPVLITGGAGFIGSNLAESFLREGRDVMVLDNLSRLGVEENLAWLAERHGPRLRPVLADLRDEQALRDAACDAEAVIHLAAQTAVTTSLVRPIDDFEVNARGTINLLEAIRATGRRVPVILASTNKVYGGLEDVELVRIGETHVPADPRLRARGVGEDRPIAFRTPYGCSKGVADQYVLDYAKSFDLPTAVLRMSCVYGQRQFGTEDQGWVAHFLIRALRGEPITLFGDGCQVRDILHVDDAARAYRAVLDRIDALSGRAFNLGGGPANAVSLVEVLAEIERLVGAPAVLAREGWRSGDQLWFVADTGLLAAETGWRAEIGWRDGLARLAAWFGAAADEPARLRA
ncbi:NAD-dependent epimerase/dehydratase family protein [Amaricoccus solimangrovi]|uniref:NAD-dependent epimerase/dehydratase family protein n=1 Tax=Amaricoccus solimangrovi TaxID=2589815 RepID=A0A501WQA3_9RHOB|nr:NAD-dependent epimerase/dehydratase family protein [Amaricoccus solimangrovi]TPE51649.1 NAD-dependent epimerase/dehydratase family protein [Amaricoccus solimangrovi]